MSCKFKVGETYPTRDGSKRKVVYIGRDEIVVEQRGELHFRRLDGSVFISEENDYDLILPEPKTMKDLKPVGVVYVTEDSECIFTKDEYSRDKKQLKFKNWQAILTYNVDDVEGMFDE